MQFVDSASVADTRTTDDGYLVAEIRCARTGIQHYTGAEVGKPEIPVVNVYRDAAEVFDKKSLATFAGKPVTNDHPTVPVTSENWKDVAVGSIGNEIARDGEFVKVPVMLMDAATIDAVNHGKREVSMGYSMDLVFEDGVAPCGTPYQAKQTNLRMNHLAVVARGRAGHECRVGDAANQWGVSPVQANVKDDNNMADKLKTMTIDGIPVEVNDTAAAVITKLQSDLKTALDGAIAKQGEHQTAIDAANAELGKKDVEIAELKKSAVDGAALDKLVADRTALVAKAATIAKDADFTGMSDADIMRAAVVAAHGEAFAADKAPAYIEAAFDMAVASAPAGDKVDPVKQVLAGDGAATQVTDNGQSAYHARLTAGRNAPAA